MLLVFIMYPTFTGFFLLEYLYPILEPSVTTSTETSLSEISIFGDIVAWLYVGIK